MGGVRRVMVVGHSGAGKDTACEYLAQVTRLRFAGTTSVYLARYVAARLGVTVEQTYRTRHANRNLWHKVGNDVRRLDPARLVRESLEHAELTGGVRKIEELQACRREGLVDLVVWVANDRARPGPTLTISPRDCDVVVENHDTLQGFHERLFEMAQSHGFPMKARREKSWMRIEPGEE
jgi:cytidylate kinase